jgi:ABC-type multidrug transport system ATPase subunit
VSRPDDGWGGRLEAELVRLGLQPARARALRDETQAQTAEAGAPADRVFGPAHLYARQLAVELGDLAVRPSTRTAVAEPGRVLLELVDVSKRYRRRPVFEGVNLTLRAGEVAAVVGANGCGKSTLLRICAGLVKPSGGVVRRTARVGFVPQDGGTVDWLTPAEHFTLFGAVAGMGRRRAASTGEHLAGRLAWRPRPGQLAVHLSGGDRQKLNLVLGELHAPDLLLLDEPYQGFDEGTYLNFWHQVTAWRDAGCAVVVVTHLLHELENVDRVLDLGAVAR